MSKPTIQIHNIETGEIIEREMNNAELAKYNEGIEAADNMKAEAEAKATQKAALLDRLGITEDEAKLLLG
jgi:lipoate synthase